MNFDAEKLMDIEYCCVNFINYTNGTYNELKTSSSLLQILHVVKGVPTEHGPRPFLSFSR